MCQLQVRPEKGTQGMRIKLPALQRARCTNLTVCGQLLSPDEALVKRLAEAKGMVAKCGSRQTTTYIRVLPGGKSGKHLHVECATQRFFPEGFSPKTTHRKAEAMGLVEAACGQEMESGLTGYFVMKLDDLPETGLVRSVQAKKTIGDLSIELTGATFSIRGAPISKLQWSIGPDASEVLVRIRADRTMRVGESYLLEALSWLEKQIGVFIRGKSIQPKE